MPTLVVVRAFLRSLEPAWRMKFLHSSGDTQPMMERSASHNASTVRKALARNSAFSLANTCSMGFGSGLQGGRNRTLAPAASMAWRTAGFLCDDRLSVTTMSSGVRIGTRTCST
jgi:hypothetical protein